MFHGLPSDDGYQFSRLARDAIRDLLTVVKTRNCLSVFISEKILRKIVLIEFISCIIVRALIEKLVQSWRTYSMPNISVLHYEHVHHDDTNFSIKVRMFSCRKLFLHFTLLSRYYPMVASK